MPRTPAFLALVAACALALGLAACSRGSDGEDADDFAARIDGGLADGGAVASAASGAGNRPVTAGVPAAAADGRQALQRAAYVQKDADGATSALTLTPGGDFRLIEGGVTRTGRYEWLPDGRRLRLLGIEERPIVVVADGALYRVTNENVPLDDLVPERMYRPDS